MSNIWFSSDWHLMHKNIAGPMVSSWKEGYRNFIDEYSMTDTIIKTFNKYVKPDDSLWYLGDFAFKDHTKIPGLVNSFNSCVFNFIRGNHDEHIDKYSAYFAQILDKFVGKIGGYNFTLDHYAHRCWLGSHKGYFHLYGHSHDSLEREAWGRSMDVGIDSAYRLFGEYRPFKLEEVVEILSKRDPKLVDHHDATTNVK